MTDMHFIKGAKTAGTSGRSQNVYNPASGSVTSSVPLASAAEIDAAVAVAKAALPGWANTPPAKRAQVMFKFRELIIKNYGSIIGNISWNLLLLLYQSGNMKVTESHDRHAG